MLGKLFAVLFAAIVAIASGVVTSIGPAAQTQTPVKVAFIGDLSVNSAFTHKGLFFIPSGVGIIPNNADDANHIAYITDQLAQSSAPRGSAAGTRTSTTWRSAGALTRPVTNAAPSWQYTATALPIKWRPLTFARLRSHPRVEGEVQDGQVTL